ncbi:rod shape-determining protein RodA [bacterium]|nr:rod shape-determining protein RodA [bacterium]
MRLVFASVPDYYKSVGILGSQYSPDMDPNADRKMDWVLLWAMLAVIVMGLVNLYSAATDPLSATTGYFLKQVIYYGIGFVLMGAILFFDYRFYERIAYVLYGLNFLALLLVRLPGIGIYRNGARQWINLGPVMFQPSETMKLALIMALAAYFHNKVRSMRMGVRELLVPSLIVVAPVLLIVMQPDMGTGMHLFITGSSILFFVGIQRRILLTVTLLGIISAPIVWQYGLKEYQRDRIRTFLDPTRDPRGHGYNALQSKIAVGSGEIFGKGFTKGTQTQLDFTPEGHTDFIFSVLAEEWGFVGCLLLLAAYLLLLSRIVSIALMAQDRFAMLIAIGVLTMISSQVVINIFMVIGLFPIVGIPLPLASYGGSSALNVCASLGLVLNIGYRRGIF